MQTRYVHMIIIYPHTQFHVTKLKYRIIYFYRTENYKTRYCHGRQNHRVNDFQVVCNVMPCLVINKHRHFEVS